MATPVTSVNSGSNVQAILASVTQELTETAAQTKIEAAKGDQQAVRKLAHLQLQQPTQSVSSRLNRAAPDSTGYYVDEKR